MQFYCLYARAGPAIVTTKDAGDAITLLQSLVGSTFDSSQLVLTACMGFLAITESRLQELREKHRPSVLAIVEERSKKGQAWKDSKGLASKLYSFKHDPSIIEEKSPTEGSTDGDVSRSKSGSSNLDEFLSVSGLSVSEVDSLPDLHDQVAFSSPLCLIYFLMCTRFYPIYKITVRYTTMKNNKTVRIRRRQYGSTQVLHEEQSIFLMSHDNCRLGATGNFLTPQDHSGPVVAPPLAVLCKLYVEMWL